MNIENKQITPVILRNKEEAVPIRKVEIVNGPVDLSKLTEPARKRVVRAQEWGAGKLCVPVAVEIKGGSYIPAANGDNLQPWDTAGEFRFSLFLEKGQGKLAEHTIRYALTNDGRMKRLIPSETGNDLDRNGNLIPIIEWRRDVLVHRVDARVSRYTDPETGKDVAGLSFIAVPEPGQWSGSDSTRTFSNSSDNPLPLSKQWGIIFNCFH